MKSEKGITLISLIVYLIAMVMVVAVVAIISGYFYKNTKGLNESIDPIGEYTKFNTFFSEEVNHENIKVLDCQTNSTNPATKESYIVFDNGVQYTFIKENKGIYRNKVKICREVENCDFTYEIINGKAVVSVNFTAGNKTRSTTYTLKN